MSVDKRFVKSATTSTSVVNSKSEVEKMLRRYGADAFSVEHDYVRGRAQVRFVVPDSGAADAGKVPIRIPVNVQAVYHALFGQPTRWMDGKRVPDPKGYDVKKMEQAERVAWRNLVLWIDAALSTAAIQLQTISETFFAHAVIGPNGETAAQLVALTYDTARLLGAGASDDHA